MKRRKFFQYASFGGVGLVLASKESSLASVAQSAGAQSSNSKFPKSSIGAPLESFTYRTPTVDRAGRITQQQSFTAQFFSESLPHTKRHSGESSDTRLEMVALSGGMSSHRRVKLSPFFISKYPIVQSQWAAIAALPKIHRELTPAPAHFRGSALPVESISWLEAVEFCDRLTKHTGRQYQLPSEAQWEYACRAGTHTPFHTGETITGNMADYVSTYTYKSEPPGRYRKSTLPVGEFLPNAFGLHDMHGNVWEWCADKWQAADRQGLYRQARAQTQRAIRGGSWLDGPDKLRSANRSGYDETGLNRTIGFRVVAT